MRVTASTWILLALASSFMGGTRRGANAAGGERQGNVDEERIEFRIVEGLPKPKYSATNHQSQPVKPTPSRDPKTPDPTTPPSLLLLNGRCFSSQIGNYKYEICPFQNVTQLDTAASWNAFYGILGIWDSWVEGTDYTVGEFTDGTKCGATPRKITVSFKCAEAPRIESVAEPETCKYTAELHAPELCESAERALAMLAAREHDAGSVGEDVSSAESDLDQTGHTSTVDGAPESQLGHDSKAVDGGHSAHYTNTHDSSSIQPSLSEREDLIAENAALREKLARLESLISQGQEVFEKSDDGSSSSSSSSTDSFDENGDEGSSSRAKDKYAAKAEDTAAGRVHLGDSSNNNGASPKSQDLPKDEKIKSTMSKKEAHSGAKKAIKKAVKSDAKTGRKDVEISETAGHAHSGAAESTIGTSASATDKELQSTSSESVNAGEVVQNKEKNGMMREEDKTKGTNKVRQKTKKKKTKKKKTKKKKTKKKKKKKKKK